MDAVERVYRSYENWRGEKFVYGRSALGAPLVGFFVGRHGYPEIVAQYAIHAREWVTSLMALAHAEAGLARGGAYILPLANPDGAALCIRGERFLEEMTEREAAFLRRVNGGGDFSLWKANARAVDCNVNFPALWGTGRSNAFAPAPQNYVGEFPLSERESRALARFTLKVRPAATVSYHTKGREIYWDFYQTGAEMERDLFLAQSLAKATGYRLGSAPGSAGGYKDWCIRSLGIPAFTIEAGADALSHPIREAALPILTEENGGALSALTEALIKWKTR